MQRELQIVLVAAIVAMAAFVGYLYFRQIPKQIAKNTEPVYTVATPEVISSASPAPQTASIKTTADLNSTLSGLDQVDFNEFDKELSEVDF